MAGLISVRVDKILHHQMKLHEEINWSAVLRKSIAEQLKKNKTIDFERARHAAQSMDKIRRSGIFEKGKSGVEIIREWREKRK